MFASGLSTTAARYLHRALDEPPPVARQCAVRLRHGQALALGQVAAAIPELREAYRQAPDDGLRTDAAVALAKTHGYADHSAMPSACSTPPQIAALTISSANDCSPSNCCGPRGGPTTRSEPTAWLYSTGSRRR